MKYFSVSGYSNSGKTSLILDLYRELKNKNYNVAIIKHSEHNITDGNKDTDLFLKAGVKDVIFWGKDGIARYSMEKFELKSLLSLYNSFDFVIIEGGKHIDELQKIWIGKPDKNIKNIIAIVTGEEKKWKIATFSRDDTDSLVSFILSL